MRHACLALALGLSLLGFAALAQGQTPPAKPPFAALDTDKNGRLTLDEVLAHAKKQSARVAPFRISDADLDGDGRLSAEEQRKAGIQGLEGFGAVDLKELDVHGDGYVSREDLDEFFRRKHREAFARADADQDGVLRPDEFVLFRF
ncbi:MAG: hypothetical protein KKA55_00550 [Proteobacteria bacterium]|nr:hypothetical protein [Pseudomonadota bacterium]MBU1594005.1 hypothetical protein [Pseudomonadota bacterium]